MSTVIVLLCIAVNQGCNLSQTDVKNKILQGTLIEKVYVNFPLDHKNENNASLASKFHKAIYGKKQLPRAWYAN